LGSEFGAITLVDDAVHETADGRRFLVIHGDQFDVGLSEASDQSCGRFRRAI
jgi:UDP-2,3-diacylglucosamine pyrophosphatase LpxH